MADVDLPLRLSENSLATLLGLVREQVAVARDLTEQALTDGDPETAGAFMHQRAVWQELERPLLDAVKRLRDRLAASGTIETIETGDAL